MPLAGIRAGGGPSPQGEGPSLPLSSAASSPQIPVAAGQSHATSDAGASPPSPADGGTVLARGKALGPAARAPSAALPRAARGARTETRATAEGRSAGGSSSGQLRRAVWLHTLVMTLVERVGGTPQGMGPSMLASIDAMVTEHAETRTPKIWPPPIAEASLWLPTRAASRGSTDGEVYRSGRACWFEGEHPWTSWPGGSRPEVPRVGYAPSEYRKKPWPEEVQIEGWFPLSAREPQCFDLVEDAIDNLSRRERPSSALASGSDANRGREADREAHKARRTSRLNPGKPRRTCRLGADASVEESGGRSGEICLDTTFHRRKSKRLLMSSFACTGGWSGENRFGCGSFATRDLDGAILLASRNNRNAIYLCGQAAEKVIRAILTSEGKHGGIKHRLDELVDRKRSPPGPVVELPHSGGCLLACTRRQAA